MIGPKISAHLNDKAVDHRMVDLEIKDYRELATNAGADYTSLCKAMSKSREPSKMLLLRLSVALGMSFDDLLTVTVDHPEMEAAA